MKGQGFTVMVNQDDLVTVGQLLIEVDWDYLRENAESSITPIIITNSDERLVEYLDLKEGIMGETVIMTALPK